MHVPMNLFWTGSLKQTIWTNQNEGLPYVSSVLLMHKLVWDCFYVERPTHENVFVCHFLQPLWTIWPRTWVCQLREGWSWAIIRRCWDFCRWRRDRLTESKHCKHTFTRSQMHKHLLRPDGAPASAGTSVRGFSLIFKTRNSCHSIWRDLLVILGSDKGTMQWLQARRRTPRTARTHSEPFPKRTFTSLCIVVYESQCHYNG